MSWESFILFAIVALVCWALGAFAAWKGAKPGMGLRIYRSGAGCLFQFHCRYVGFVGTASDADDGRDPPVVFFLSSVSRADNLCAVEVQMDS